MCLLFLGLLFLLRGITHAIECHAGFEGLGTENNCGDIDECTENPSLCGNNSVCKNTEGSYFCSCKHGFISSKKELKKFNATHRVECRGNQFMCTDVTVADIVMVIDDSWRIGRLNFKAICKFLEKVVNAFDVGIDKVRIGLVKYSGDPKIEWHLNSYTTKDEVITSLRNLPFKGGATMTGRALTFFRENSFRLQSGSRGNVSKIAILVTKGKSQDEMAVPAQSLRDAGVELFVIGVAYINETELKLIASKPDETHVYNVPDISFLNDILDGLTSNVCDAIKRQEEEIRRVKNADEELKVITSKPDETHVYNITDFSTINTVTEGQTCNVIDTVKQQEEKIRPLEQMRIFCLKNADAEEP